MITEDGVTYWNGRKTHSESDLWCSNGHHLAVMGGVTDTWIWRCKHFILKVYIVLKNGDEVPAGATNARMLFLLLHTCQLMKITWGEQVLISNQEDTTENISWLFNSLKNNVLQLVGNCLLGGDGQVERLYQSFFSESSCLLLLETRSTELRGAVELGDNSLWVCYH